MNQKRWVAASAWKEALALASTFALAADKALVVMWEMDYQEECQAEKYRQPALNSLANQAGRYQLPRMVVGT
jgi:hypothetical protein